MTEVIDEERPERKKPFFNGIWSRPKAERTEEARTFQRDTGAGLAFERRLAELLGTVPATADERLRAARWLLPRYEALLTLGQVALAKALIAAAATPTSGGRSRRRGKTGPTKRPPPPQQQVP